jgi:hypothetical protein
MILISHKPPSFVDHVEHDAMQVLGVCFTYNSAVLVPYLRVFYFSFRHKTIIHMHSTV